MIFSLEEDEDVQQNPESICSHNEHDNDNEKRELYDSIEILLVETLEEMNAINYHNYYFEELIKNSIYSHFSMTMDETDFDDFYNTNIEELYINNGLVKRCFKNTDSIENFNSNVINYDENLIYLQNVKQPEQKTIEWYEFRYDHITGSNAWKIFGTPSSKNQLYYEKLQPFDTNKYVSFKSNITDSPLNWGHKYEPLTTQLYEYYNDVEVKEFGCIPHKSIPYLAASPDGIVVSDKMKGRMIEIKNVVSREINKIPKMEYYIQMQIQMEVCDLDECDFVETKFVEYDSYVDFKEDVDNYEKGMICVIMENNNEPRFIYEYCPLFENSDSQLDDFTSQIYKKYDINEEDDDNKYTWIKNIYWRLEVYSNVLVQRNKKWFEQALPEIKEFWNHVIEERKVPDSYLKYRPKSRAPPKEKPVSKPISLIQLNNYMKNDSIETSVSISPSPSHSPFLKESNVIDLNSI